MRSEKTPLILTPRLRLLDFGSAEEVLWWATHENQANIVHYLARDPSVDVNATDKHGSTPFYVAVYKGHLELVSLLTSIDRVDVNKPCAGSLDATPFWIACRLGHLDMVKLLMRTKSINVERPNRYGVTPLQAARIAGNLDIIDLLDATTVPAGSTSSLPLLSPPKSGGSLCHQ